MNTYREDDGKQPCTPAAPPGEPEVLDVSPARAPLPEGWRRLPTGLRGTRLYRVAPPGGGGVYWVAEMPLNGRTISRRFAGELHARGWISATTETRPKETFLDLEELNGPFRAACVVAGKIASIRVAGRYF
ncbi:MAG TPA: hypothetical protein VKC51_10720 [Lacunisphaera sp.]|nr:hypothetical protein [Lacunisphaera sp.]